MRAVVEGKEALLLLDTGAGGFWLDREFATGLGLVGKPGKADFAEDGPVDTVWYPEVKVGLGAWKEDLAIVRGFAMPKSLVQEGIVGIFNPLRLLNTGLIIIDFPARRLSIIQEAQKDPLPWLNERFPGRRFEAFKRQVGYLPPYDDPDAAFYSVVNGRLGDLPERPLLLDSGAGGLIFRDNYVGKKPGTVVREPERLTLGGRELKVSAYRVGPHRDGKDVAGSLGMRVLRRLILALPAGSDNIMVGFPR